MNTINEKEIKEELAENAALNDEDLEDAAGGRNIASALLAGVMMLSGMSCVAASAAEAPAVTDTADPDAETAAPVSEAKTEREKIQNYFNTELKTPQSVTTQTYRAANGMAVKRTLEKGADGKYMIVTTTPRTVDYKKQAFSALNNFEKFYPGVLVYADENLANGNPSLIDIKTRNPIDVTVSYAPMKSGQKAYVTLDNPTQYSLVDDQLRQLRDRFDKDKASPALINYTLTSVNSEQDFKASANFSEEIYGKLKIDFSAASHHKKQIVVMEYDQIYYKLTANQQLGAAAFSDATSFETVSNLITNQKPAAMITSVAYGRKIVACIETSDMSFNLKTTLEGELKKVKAGGEVSVNNKLNNCNVSYYIYGGTAGKGAEIIEERDPTKMLKKINEEAVFTPEGALPVSYTATYLKDGRDAYVQYEGNACDVTIEELKPIPFKIDTDRRSGRVKRYDMRVEGCRRIEKEVLDENTGEKTTVVELGEPEVLTELHIKSDGPCYELPEIPADVDPTSIVVYYGFDGTGQKTDDGFDPARNNIKVKALCSNAADISEIRIKMDSYTKWWGGYSVKGEMDVISKDGASHYACIEDD